MRGRQRPPARRFVVGFREKDLQGEAAQCAGRGWIEGLGFPAGLGLLQGVRRLLRRLLSEGPVPPSIRRQRRVPPGPHDVPGRGASEILEERLFRGRPRRPDVPGETSSRLGIGNAMFLRQAGHFLLVGLRRRQGEGGGLEPDCANRSQTERSRSHGSLERSWKERTGRCPPVNKLRSEGIDS